MLARALGKLLMNDGNRFLNGRRHVPKPNMCIHGFDITDYYSFTGTTSTSAVLHSSFLVEASAFLSKTTSLRLDAHAFIISNRSVVEASVCFLTFERRQRFDHDAPPRNDTQYFLPPLLCIWYRSKKKLLFDTRPWILIVAHFLSPSQERCRFCPDGGIMASPHHVLPQSKLTCIEIEEMIFANLSQESCETARSFYRDIAIDILSFCGCSGAPPVDLCPFCDGTVDFPKELSSRTTNDGNGNTCADLAALAPFVTDPDYCRDYIQSFEDSCCPAIVEPPSYVPCSICPPGSIMKSPLRKNALFRGKTCASMDSELWLVPEGSCSYRRDELSHGLDLASFCSCEGVEPPSVFTFCDGGDIVVSDPSIDIVAPRSASGGLTCQEALELAPYFSSSEWYGNELGPLTDACCQRQQSCSLCSDGSSARFPDRPLEFGRTQPRCEAFEISLRLLSSEECTDIHERNIPIDFKSWCGCANAPIPDKCALCGEGMTLTNENVEIPDTGGMTCGDADEYARHVLDTGYCEAILAVLSSECCALAPAKTGRRWPEVFVVSPASTRAVSAVNCLLILVIGIIWMTSL
jgi:hypothetical protein